MSGNDSDDDIPFNRDFPLSPGRVDTIAPGIRRVVAGNPGRVVKMRFPSEIVAELLAIRWWDWDADKIARHVDAIQGADIDALRGAV